MFKKSLSLKVLFVKQEEALTNIQFVYQSNRNDAYDDLAPWDKGYLRYLKMIRNNDSYTRINRVGLLRSPRHTWIYGDRKEFGWDECTSDMNEKKVGRDEDFVADYLHLCWNTISTAFTF